MTSNIVFVNLFSVGGLKMLRQISWSYRGMSVSILCIHIFIFMF